MSHLSLDLTLHLIVVYLPIPELYGCYGLSCIHVTSGLKSGWCNKHGNIKENETMTIEIVRKSQKKTVFPVLYRTPPITQRWCIVSIQERGKQKY